MAGKEKPGLKLRYRGDDRYYARLQDPRKSGQMPPASRNQISAGNVTDKAQTSVNTNIVSFFGYERDQNPSKIGRGESREITVISISGRNNPGMAQAS